MRDVVLMEAVSSTASTPYKKKYKCPFCELRVERSKLHLHIQDKHEELIPEGWTALRVAFNTINKKTEGHCIICNKVTEWNEDKGRYERLCGNPACKEAYKKMVADRNRNKYGTDRLQSDPRYAEEVQKRALAGRSISGNYKFEDGGTVPYVGSYEKRFLKFMDEVMKVESTDIIAPGPSIEYEWNGARHIYLPDFYYTPYNLIVEIKDGGDNPNKNPHMTECKGSRQDAKEDAVRKSQIFNYVRLTNNDFGQLISIMAVLKYNMQVDCYDPIVMVHESAIEESVLLETRHKSVVDDSYSPKGKKRLTEFKSVNVTTDVQKKYAKVAKLLAEAGKDEFGKAWVDDEDNLVGYCMANDYGWLTAIEVSKAYRGFGLSDQILKYAIKNFGVNRLGVYKDNEVAIRLYKKNGFVEVPSKVVGGSGEKNMIFMTNDKSLVGVKESSDTLSENMSGAIGAALAPWPVPYEANKSNYYIVQHPQNHAFAYGITKDPFQSEIFSVDPEDEHFYKVFKSKKGDLDKKYLTFKIKNQKAAEDLYNELARIYDEGDVFWNDDTSRNYIYDVLTGGDQRGDQIISPDQLLFDSRFELVRDFDSQLAYEAEALREWLTNDETVEDSLKSIDEQLTQLEEMSNE